MNYHIQWAKDRYNAGEEWVLLPFWGHQSESGKVGKQCFSQWYPCDFTVDDVPYHTAEQYMMAQKALLFDDREIYEQIMAADDPKTYQALGRKIRNFSQSVWDRNKFDIVVRGNVAKFGQNPELLDFLLSTGSMILVEASPYDNVWGVKLRSYWPEINDPNQWRGENLLGFALMEVRDILRKA